MALVANNHEGERTLLAAIHADDAAAVERAWEAAPAWDAPLSVEAVNAVVGFSHFRQDKPASFWAIDWGAQNALSALLDLRDRALEGRALSPSQALMARDELALAAEQGMLAACQKIQARGWASPKLWLAASLLRDLSRKRGKKIPGRGGLWGDVLEPVVEWIVSAGGELDAPLSRLNDQALTARERAMSAASWKQGATLMGLAGTGRVAKALMSAGADPNGVLVEKRLGGLCSPLEMAMDSGRKDWIEALARGGASLEPMFGDRAKEWESRLGEGFAQRARVWALEGARDEVARECAPLPLDAKPARPRL
jgi:hypothetical protein